MSMISCQLCGDQTDSDFNEMFKIDDLDCCESCYEQQQAEAELEGGN